jgi:hypothetical protein
MIDAMKAALKELEDVLDCINQDKIPFDGDDFHETLRNLRQAIADAEKQDGWVLREVYFSEGEPIGHREPQAEKQKPVAYRKEAHGMWFYIENKPSPPNDDYEPLYTAPPKREIEQEPESWMGVSDNPYCNDADCNDPDSRAMRWHNKLLELRKQVALDGLAETSREIEQEPVVWWNGQGYNFGADDEDFIYPATRQNHIKAGSPADYWSIPLYTAPPKREWVDLDDNDIQDTEHFCGDVFEFARAIGAKLRERNT